MKLVEHRQVMHMIKEQHKSLFYIIKIHYGLTIDVYNGEANETPSG